MTKDRLSLKNSISRRIKEIRKKFGLSQKDFAKKMETPERNISNIEVGVCLPTLPFVKRLLDNFDISPLWIIKGNGDMFLYENNPKNSQLSHFKQAFPEVPAEPDVIKVIESMAIPLMKNAILHKALELKETYKSQILEYEKEKAQANASSKIGG